MPLRNSFRKFHCPNRRSIISAEMLFTRGFRTVGSQMSDSIAVEYTLSGKGEREGRRKGGLDTHVYVSIRASSRTSISSACTRAFCRGVGAFRLAIGVGVPMVRGDIM